VTQKAFLGGHCHAPKHQRTAFHQAMDVIPGAYADGSTSGMTLDARITSAIARS